VDSPFRSRTVAENLARFREMRDGKLDDGAAVLRAKISMQSPNINLRDPAIYRIRRATHHHTGDKWCIYPMYTFAHPIEDALEQITHSLCTLEFEDQRPFYDWLMDRLCEPRTLPDGRVVGALLAAPSPKQYEFARLNLTYVITSKRKLAQLVNEGKVSGWDDPRMPTIVGLRRRGYTPTSLRLFADRIGVTKSDSWIDYSTLEGCLREDLENKAHRGMAVLDPVKLVLTNWAEAFGADDYTEACSQPALPHSAIAEGQTPPADRTFLIGKEVWIEREDFEEVPPKGYKRLFPGNVVRLKGGYVIECTGCARDAAGKVTEVQAKVIPGTKSGTPGADSVKAKAAITWVAVADGVQAEVRLYDRLFADAHPDAGGKDFLQSLNPDSLKVVKAYVEPSLAGAQPDQKFQFERFGYFVADRMDHLSGIKPVFNRVTGLKDSWGK
jgi:glutaminyl-tRNA synthetase